MWIPGFIVALYQTAMRNQWFPGKSAGFFLPLSSKPSRFSRFNRIFIENHGEEFIEYSEIIDKLHENEENEYDDDEEDEEED